ncbi:hypothetical protein TWF730_010850 [Orbilia blumenaviensis]|uniref:AA9 family lytic polysaccharide monooxygenase n=1 Tax=Orbilia blumenaviensis TaxID=1796055 RepID=A0AAV9UJS2_9PEZI
MKIRYLIAVGSIIALARAHTRIGKIWVNDIDQGNGAGRYIRQPPTNNPLLDVNSADMICNTNNIPVNGFVSAKPGDTITMQWFKDSIDPSDIVTDGSHVGPVTVYMADMSLSDTGQGAVWTKVYQDGQVGDSWAVSRLRENPTHGKQKFTIPPRLKTGFYPSCSQFNIIGPANGISLPGGFDFVGGYKPNDPSIHIDVYSGVMNYKVPGPEIWGNAAPVLPIGQPGGDSGPTTTFRTSAVKASTTKLSITLTRSINGNGDSCVAKKFGQCGGVEHSGCIRCPPGTDCRMQNRWYFQCLP